MDDGLAEKMEYSISIRSLDDVVIIKSWNRHEEEARRREKTLRRRALPHRDKKIIHDHVRDNLDRVADTEATARTKDGLDNPDYIIGKNGTIVERNPSDSKDQRDTGVPPDGLPRHVQDALRNAKFIQDDGSRFGHLLSTTYIPIRDADPTGRLWKLTMLTWPDLWSTLPDEDGPFERSVTNRQDDPDFAIRLSASVDVDGTHRLEVKIDFI